MLGIHYIDEYILALCMKINVIIINIINFKMTVYYAFFFLIKFGTEIVDDPE